MIEGRTLDYYAKKNKRISLLLENARRNPSEIQQLMRVKTILNKEVEAKKEGKFVNKQIMEFNNDPNNKKKLQVDDLPDYVLEEAGCGKKTRKKEKAVMVRYKAEKVDNYIGDQDVDTILKCIEDPKPIRRMKSPSKNQEQIADQNIEDDDSDSSEVPEDIKRQINKIAMSMIVDHINSRDPTDPEPKALKLSFTAKKCSPPPTPRTPEPIIEQVENMIEEENDKPEMKLKSIKCYEVNEDSERLNKVPSRDIRTYKDSEMMISFDADGLKDQLVDFWESHPEDQIPDAVKEKIREHKEKRSYNCGDNTVSLDEKVPNIQDSDNETIKSMQTDNRPEKSYSTKDKSSNYMSHMDKTEAEFREYAKQKCLDDVGDKLPENIKETLGQLMDSFTFPTKAPVSKPNSVVEPMKRDQKPREPENPLENAAKVKKCLDDAKARLPENVRESLGHLMDCMAYPNADEAQQQSDYFGALHKLQETNQRNKKLQELESSDDKDLEAEDANLKVPSENGEEKLDQNDNSVCASHTETNKKNIEGNVKKIKKSKKPKKPKKPLERGICDNPRCISQSVHRCSRCLQVAFCSPQCQEEHWPEHQEDCTPWRQRRRRQQLGAGVD